jgi:hypothetical protein
MFLFGRNVARTRGEKFQYAAHAIDTAAVGSAKDQAIKWIAAATPY